MYNDGCLRSTSFPSLPFTNRDNLLLKGSRIEDRGAASKTTDHELHNSSANSSSSRGHYCSTQRLYNTQYDDERSHGRSWGPAGSGRP